MSGKSCAAGLIGLAAVMLFCSIVPAAAELPPLSGAIWTTTGTGEKVDANLYDQKCPPSSDPCVTPPLVPFLNGGPNFASPTQWVPDGEYYFQVTDPSGKVLLSSDDIEARRFEVYTDGVGVKHTDYPLGGNPAPHIVCSDFLSGNITIALCPFDDTPNNGNEYKLWITPVEAYWANGEEFVGRQSKTDNFKVKQLASIWGDKVDECYDPVEDVCIILYEVVKVRGEESLVEIDRTCTNAAGEFSFTGLSAGKYAVDEDLSCTDCGGDFSDWERISPEGPIVFTIKQSDLGGRGSNGSPGDPIYIGQFRNGPTVDLVAVLEGDAFSDCNEDGCWDLISSRVWDSVVCLDMKDGNGSWVQAEDIYGTPVACQTTTSGAGFSFGDLPVPMTYRICQTPASGWYQTSPNLGPSEMPLWPTGDLCGSIGVTPPGADVTVIAVDGCYIVNIGATAALETEVVGLDFGDLR